MSPVSSDSIVPLLPERDSPATSATHKQPSVSGAVFNVSTSIIGAGIMSIPATLKVLGVVPAFLLIMLIALLVDVSVEFLLRFTYAGGSTTYAGVMKESFGRIGSVAVQVSVMITNLGCLIIYLIIIGDVLSGDQSVEGSVHLGVLQEWFGIHWWNTRAVAILFIVVFVMLPLVLYRRVELLAKSSAVAVLLAVVFVGICTAMAVAAAVKGQSKSIRMLPQLDDQAAFFNLFTAIPVIVTAFTFHFNVHAIGMELGKPAAMASAVRISLILCALIYFSIGLFGYILFGDSIEADILVNFDEATGSTIGSLLNDTFMGSTSAVCIAFIFPGALALRDVHGISSRKDKIIGATMIVLAVITSTIAISSNLYSLGI
ncbi:putative amino acid transporter, transmembrane domain-containing protein [Helianthus debilis subsp. tardiflorus]